APRGPPGHRAGEPRRAARGLRRRRGSEAVSARPPLDAVVFDAGGTLIRLDFEWMSAAVTALGFALDPATLRRGEVEGRRRFDAARRTPLSAWTLESTEVPEDTRAYFGGMLEACGVPPAVIERALPQFLARQRGPGLWTCTAE